MTGKNHDEVAVARVRAAVIAAVLASSGGEMDSSGAIGGYIDPNTVDAALCDALAAFAAMAARGGEFATKKERRDYADDMRAAFLKSFETFIGHTEMLDQIFMPYDPRNPPLGAPGTGGVRH